MSSAAGGSLIATRASFRRVATGFGFIEGPVWNSRGQCLLFSDIESDVRRRYTEDDGITEVMRPSNKGNGMVYDAVCTTHQPVTTSLRRSRRWDVERRPFRWTSPVSTRSRVQ